MSLRHFLMGFACSPGVSVTFSVFLPSSLLLSPPSSSSYWPLFRTHAAVLSTGDIATATASTGDATCTQSSDIIRNTPETLKV